MFYKHRIAVPSSLTSFVVQLLRWSSLVLDTELNDIKYERYT